MILCPVIYPLVTTISTLMVMADSIRELDESVSKITADFTDRHYSGIVNHVIASGIFCPTSGGFSFKVAFISGIECRNFVGTGIIP